MGRGQNILSAAIGCGGGREQGRGHLGRGAGRRAGSQAGPRLQALSELVWYALHGGWLLCCGEDVPAPELGERVCRLWGRCGWGILGSRGWGWPPDTPTHRSVRPRSLQTSRWSAGEAAGNRELGAEYTTGGKEEAGYAVSLLKRESCWDF